LELDGKIRRIYTRALLNTEGSVYDLFEWKRVNVKLYSYTTGAVIADMENLEFPAGYSQSACDIIASKYFRKKGVPGEGSERSMRQLAHRMVSFWVDALYDEVMISKEQSETLYDELAYMLLAQMWAPNSPQWFNTGLKSAYGIEGPKQGHSYYDEESACVVKSSDAYTRTQGSACFILKVSDSLIGNKSLTDLLTTETLLFKYGSGVGANWSAIRGKNELLSGGGKSSGLLSFLKVSDRNAGAIKSGGTTRRAAKMNILDVDHPEILDFISWKQKEEDKAQALGKMGYSLDIDGEAYETVSGQNANNSVRVTDSFMKSLEDPESVTILKGRVESTPDTAVKSSKIWEEIGQAAWRCGDPGMQFDDTINGWHTCPRGEDGQISKDNRINASNPCSEYMFLDDTACNLASVNIMKYYDPVSDSFDIDGYRHSITLIQLVLEATIHSGHFPTEDIARRSYMFRTTGLGLTNLGAMLMSMGLPYDSDDARAVSAALVSVLTGESYSASAWMAEKVGPFPCFEANRLHMQRVVRNHARAASAYDGSAFEELSVEPQKIDTDTLFRLGYDNLAEGLKDCWDQAISAGLAFGYRNAQVSVLAPTGTIAFAMDCATTSSEPFFGHVAMKKLVGGGYMEIANPAIESGLRRLGYTEEDISAITSYVLRKDQNGGTLDGKIEDAPGLQEKHLEVFDTASRCGTGKRYISPEGHVRMMGALAPHVSGAISKTVNLPSSASLGDVLGIYKLAWQLGVKAIALYRDGCKSAQPLSASKSQTTEKPLTSYTYQELIDFINTNKTIHKPQRIKPSGIRPARVHEAAINGLKLYITTSFYEDGRLGELYVSSGRQGSLTKGLLDSMSTTISEMLQYGVPPKDIAKMHRGQKYEPSGIVTGHPYIKFVDSISDLISKIIDIELGDYTYCQVKPAGFESARPMKPLSKRTEDEYIYGEVCPNCGSSRMVKNGTCKVCTECGTTTGCS
jgi:ribonucleoside-diphosphate reductase alpha chain